MPTPVAPIRRPLDLDVRDDDAVRRWLAEMLQAQVLAHNTPLPAIYLLFDGHQEVLGWTEVVEVDPDADLGATWAAMVRRPDAERRILILRLEHEDGTTEACAFEERWEDDAPIGWWFAHRPYAMVDGLSLLRGDGWRQFQGEGPAPEPFAGILRPKGRAARLLPARAPEPKVWMQAGEIPAAMSLPATAVAMAEATRDVVVGKLHRGEAFRNLLVFRVRGRAWEQWLLGDDLPAGGDEMVRWICARGGAPDAVATAEAVLMPIDGQHERAVRVVAERDGQRVEGALLVAPKPGSPLQVVPTGWRWREIVVPEGDGWIGVAPMLSGELVTTFEGYGPPK